MKMHIKGMKYKTRIPTIARGEKDKESRLYELGEIFEGNPMNSLNPVNFDYIEGSEREIKTKKHKGEQ